MTFKIKIKNLKNRKLLLILSLAFVFLLSSLAFAIPNSLTLQGKLTDTSGASQQGTFNFTFRIYDASINGNELWSLANLSITTDVNGIYDVILTGINLSFADQYYLGIAVQGENESTPRINLTSAPYSFRANTSEALNPNASYFVTNLSISGNATIGDGTTTLAITTQRFNVTTSGSLIQAGNITLGEQIVFRLGEVIDNLVDGWLKVTGALNVSSNLFVSGSVNITGDLTVNNTFNVTAGSGNVNVGGILDAGGLRVAGNVVQLIKDAFNLGNYSTEYASTGWKRANITDYLGGAGANESIVRASNMSGWVRVEDQYELSNFTSDYDNRADRFGLSNLSNALQNNNLSANLSNVSVVSLLLGWTNLTGYPSACPSGQFVTTIGDTLTCVTPSPASGGGWDDDGSLVRLTTLNDIVSIGSNASLAKLYVNDSSALGAFLITNASGTTLFYVNGSSGKIGIGTITPVDILTIIGSVSTFGSLNATFINATEIRVGANIVQVEADAFKISNYSTEYSSTGFKRGNASEYLGGADVNASLIKSTNTTFFNLFSRVADAFSRVNLTDFFGDSGFNASVLRVGNISNIRESLYNLANFTSNYDARTDRYGNANFTTQYDARSDRFGNSNFSSQLNSANFSLWNTTFGNTTQIYTRDSEARVLIGTLNLTAVNLTEKLVVIGNVNVSGYINISGDFRTAGQVYVQGNIVQVEKDAFKISNYSTEYASTGYKLSNFTSNLNAQNASLWNRSSTNTILKFNDDNIGIGTSSPGQKLHVVGSANVSTTVNAPVVNTTLATQNITITSAAGSVIIRLG